MLQKKCNKPVKLRLGSSLTDAANMKICSHSFCPIGEQLVLSRNKTVYSSNVKTFSLYRLHSRIINH